MAVCNFHRQVSGMVSSIPAAARKWASGRPITPASFPQTTLPTLNAPNMTVTKSARPRARTHSGRASWAETLSADMTEIHETPATRLPANAVTGSRAKP